MWATTVKQALAEGSTKLRLHASEELQCTNMTRRDAARARSGLCKLSMALERLRDLRHLDLRRNGLERLPEVWLTAASRDARRRRERLAALPDELAAMPHLVRVRADGNPLQQPLPEPPRRLVVLEPG